MNCDDLATARHESVIAVLSEAAAYFIDWLDDERRASERLGQNHDWPWKGVVISMATLGGSRRWSLLEKQYDERLSWRQVVKLSGSDRRDRFLTVGRYKGRAADCLTAVFKEFSDGGPAAMRAKLDGCTMQDVILFWKEFPGFGDKYARNIMMDVYDPRFRENCFAIDSRLAKLLPMLGYRGRDDYIAKKHFLQGIAQEVKLSTWELDRLLYRWGNVVEVKLELRAPGASVNS